MDATWPYPILDYQPDGGIPIGPVSNPPVYSQHGTTQLVAGQSYVDVVFGSVQTTDEWVLVECIVVNEIDADPLNIWPGIITDKTQAGFRLQLNGMPDSSNYYLHWAVSGVNITPSPATTYSLTGPSSGSLSVASSVFTVALPPSATLTASVIVTPNDSGGGGTFTPSSVTLTTSSPSKTFTYTPASYGDKTISTTNGGPLSNPASIVFTCISSTYTLSGPSTGAVSVASTDFTAALPVGGAVLGTVTVTPSDGGGGGTFTPTSVGLTTVAPSSTFTYTPATSGTKTLSVTNDGGLIDPGNLSYNSIPPAVGYYRSLTVDHTKVSSDQTDFPVLVSVTNATLKTVANGGHVQNANGFDIGFFADSGGATPLKWEIDRWSATTGELIAWVKIPALSSTVDTVFYMRYGDPAITTDQSDKVNVWSNGFVAVYHLGNGTTLNVLDSKGAFNGTNVGATAATGQIDGCGYFNGVGAIVGAASPVTVPPLTISCWAGNIIGGTNNGVVSLLAGAGAWNGFYLTIDSGPVLTVTTVSNGFAVFGQATKSFTSASWRYLAGVFGAANNRIAVVDGVAGTTETTSVTPTVAPTDLTMAAVLVSGAYSTYLNGDIDEVRIANVARSTDWLLTEFNNQGTPSTFITLGAET